MLATENCPDVNAQGSKSIIKIFNKSENYGINLVYNQHLYEIFPKGRTYQISGAEIVLELNDLKNKYIDHESQISTEFEVSALDNPNRKVAHSDRIFCLMLGAKQVMNTPDFIRMLSTNPVSVEMKFSAGPLWWDSECFSPPEIEIKGFFKNK